MAVTEPGSREAPPPQVDDVDAGWDGEPAPSARAPSGLHSLPTVRPASRPDAEAAEPESSEDRITQPELDPLKYDLADPAGADEPEEEGQRATLYDADPLRHDPSDP